MKHEKNLTAIFIAILLALLVTTTASASAHNDKGLFLFHSTQWSK